MQFESSRRRLSTKSPPERSWRVGERSAHLIRWFARAEVAVDVDPVFVVGLAFRNGDPEEPRIAEVQDQRPSLDAVAMGNVVRDTSEEIAAAGVRTLIKDESTLGPRPGLKSEGYKRSLRARRMGAPSAFRSAVAEAPGASESLPWAIGTRYTTFCASQ
jgi:hypothetical protein